METEIYLVCQNRADGRLADPVKSDEKMYFLIEDAERHHEQLTREVGPYYGIYRSVVETVERVK
jgi:hypothetical protein